MTPGLRLPDVLPMPVSRDIKTILGFGRRSSKNWSLFPKLPKYIDVTDADTAMGQPGRALVIDRNKLTKKGKAEAIKVLEEAAAELKD